MVKSCVLLGMGDLQPLIGNPYNYEYINPYYWVDDHPLLYGNNGSLDPGTYALFGSTILWFHWLWVLDPKKIHAAGPAFLVPRISRTNHWLPQLLRKAFHQVALRSGRLSGDAQEQSLSFAGDDNIAIMNHVAFRNQGKKTYLFDHIFVHSVPAIGFPLS